MSDSHIIHQIFKRGGGVLRLRPNFVPRRFARPGKRLRLHPDDYFALGTARGAIKERWFSSVITAFNGPLAQPDEGLSYLETGEDTNAKISFRDAVEELGAALIGEDLYETCGTWPMYSKFFDYQTPLFHHLHLTDEAAARVGRCGKPEAYYFPVQLNNHLGQFPVTYFGFDSDTTQQQVKDRLAQYEISDNRITELSRAHRIELGTGWYTPPGVVHAPGSVLTYEPQLNSDVNSVYENVVAGEVYPYDFLIENCPKSQQRDLDYVLSLMDWEKNVDPHYKARYFRPPVVCADDDPRCTESWIVYGNPHFSAKQLTVQPRQTITIADPAAYGCILIQGFGRFAKHHAETAIMLRFGQASADEFFVSESTARRGITVSNHSRHEPLVILKHFGPNHPTQPSAPMT